MNQVATNAQVYFHIFLQEAGDVEVSNRSVDADEKQTMNDATAVRAEPETEEKASEEPQQPHVSKADSELPTEQPSNADVLGGEDSQQADISMASSENPPTNTTDTDISAGKPPSTKTVDAETS